MPNLSTDGAASVDSGLYSVDGIPLAGPEPTLTATAWRARSPEPVLASAGPSSASFRARGPAASGPRAAGPED